MINEEQLREIVSSNLTYYRKLNKLTQIQLAEKLNYSDKAISKWERGDSLPDLYILANIAEMYGITLNDLISEQKVQTYKSKKSIHALITVISILLVWLIATACFIILKMVNVNRAWLSFIYAIPVSSIVAIVFSSIWGNNFHLFLSVSLLIWTLPTSLVLSIEFEYIWLIYILSIPLQILAIFAILLKKKVKKENQKTAS